MEFKIGNTVYCSDHEKTGIITDIKHNEEYPIYVTFEDETTDTYTRSGKRIKAVKRYLELILGEDSMSKKESEPLNFEYIEGLGKVFTLSCGTRILKTLENTHIILPQTSNL